LSEQHEKSIFQIQELKMKVAEVEDQQKNFKELDQEVKESNWEPSIFKLAFFAT